MAACDHSAQVETNSVRTNIGLADQNIRIVVSVSAMILAVALGDRGSLMGVAGALLLLTANVGLCPLYALARINTCSENEDA